MLGNADILRKASVPVVFIAGYAEYLTGLTQIGHAGAALFALAAINGRIKGHPVADLVSLDVTSAGFNNAGSLVAHDYRGMPTARASVEAMHIAAADRADLNMHQHFVAADRRHGHILKSQFFVFMHHKRFH